MSLPDLSAPVPSLVHALTPPQVAQMMGWSRRRAFRYLKEANARMGGTLLHNANEGGKRPRWTVAAGTLKLLAPQLFNEHERVQKELVFVRDYAESTVATLDELRAKVWVLEQQMIMVLDKLAAGAVGKPAGEAT